MPRRHGEPPLQRGRAVRGVPAWVIFERDRLNRVHADGLRPLPERVRADVVASLPRGHAQSVGRWCCILSTMLARVLCELHRCRHVHTDNARLLPKWLQADGSNPVPCWYELPLCRGRGLPALQARHLCQFGGDFLVPPDSAGLLPECLRTGSRAPVPEGHVQPLRRGHEEVRRLPLGEVRQHRGRFRMPAHTARLVPALARQDLPAALPAGYAQPIHGGCRDVRAVPSRHLQRQGRRLGVHVLRTGYLPGRLRRDQGDQVPRRQQQPCGGGEGVRRLRCRIVLEHARALELHPDAARLLSGHGRRDLGAALRAGDP
mmetsp:Transcript_95944/g.311154  ORF Transcript_95944/g.311154 Transcript_95944/m.311154 type:complete len:317 (+) Transcript_95944:3123-4073(+)